MIPVKVEVDIDRNAVRDYLNNQLAQEVHDVIVMADLNRLSAVLSMSPRFIEDQFLRDPRVRIHERRKSRKRFWIYKPTIEAIVQIVDEWE